MTENQLIAHIWLSRMWGKEFEIQAMVDSRDKLNEWGVSNYDSKHIPTKSDANVSENKFIEYSILSEDIDREIQKYLLEMSRTRTIIQKADSPLVRGILYDFYVNHEKIHEICNKYHYGKTAVYENRNKGLDLVFRFIPTMEVDLESLCWIC